MFLVMDIRKAALVAFMASVLGVLLPGWNGAHRMAAMEPAHPPWWFAPTVVAVVLFTVILPAFYFALYRNQGTLRFSRHLRLLALTAALALGVITVAELPGWIESLGRAGARSVLTPGRGPLTLHDISELFGMLANTAYILTMVAVYRQASDEPVPFAPVSKFLRVMARVAVTAWGIWVTFNFIRLVITPYNYAVLQGVALRTGQTPPPFRDMVADAARILLSQASLFAGPYIIWRGIAKPESECPPAGSLSME
jgi:hypothetical protein